MLGPAVAGDGRPHAAREYRLSALGDRPRSQPGAGQPHRCAHPRRGRWFGSRWRRGTLLITESSIICDKRNPGMSKADIEDELMRLLGIEKVINFHPGKVSI